MCGFKLCKTVINRVRNLIKPQRPDLNRGNNLTPSNTPYGTTNIYGLRSMAEVSWLQGCFMTRKIGLYQTTSYLPHYNFVFT